VGGSGLSDRSFSLLKDSVLVDNNVSIVINRVEEL